MVYRFEEFELDPGLRELRRNGAALDVEPQVFDLLLYLIENAKSVVSKDELLEHIWDGRIVSESTLSSRINAARRAVSDSGKQQRLIRTVPRRGFRFTGEVLIADSAAAPASPRPGEPEESRATAAYELRPLPRIAVVPFKNLGDDAAGAAIADGFREDLTAALSQLDNLSITHVTPMGVSAADRAFESSVVDSGALQATHIITGSIRLAGDRIRITAQLIDLKTDDQLWADKIDGTLGNVFEFLDDIVETIVTALEVRLSDGEQVRSWRKEAGTAKAYENFIRARAAYKEYSRAGNARARTGYQAAVELSPEFTPAMVGLARTHIEDATFSWSGDRAASLAEARRLITAALDIAPSHAPAHFELAHLRLVEGDFEVALREAESSIKIDPNSGEAYTVLAHVLCSLGRHKDSIRAANRSVRLNPSVPEYYLIPLLDSYIALSRYDEAMSVLERIEARRPEWISACVLAVALHMSLGRHETARSYVDRVLRRNPSLTITKWRGALYNPDRADISDRVAQLRQAGLPE